MASIHQLLEKVSVPAEFANVSSHLLLHTARTAGVPLLLESGSMLAYLSTPNAIQRATTEWVLPRRNPSAKRFGHCFLPLISPSSLLSCTSLVTLFEWPVARHRCSALAAHCPPPTTHTQPRTPSCLPRSARGRARCCQACFLSAVSVPVSHTVTTSKRFHTSTILGIGLLNVTC